MDNDISMCSPTKFLKKCRQCYRMTAKPSQWQSYANFYDGCIKHNYTNFLKEPK
jgi:hypothetical protein